MKRRVWQDGSEVVLRDYDEFNGCDVERRFWVPPGGGYVREVSSARPGVLGQQVCAELSHRGGTLTATPQTLIGVIRKEFRSREKKTLARRRLIGLE